MYIGKKGRQNRKSANVFPVKSVETDGKILVSRKQRCTKSLSEAKMADLRSMLNLMPIVDREYYECLGIKF